MSYGVTGLPSSFLVAPDGIVYAYVPGEVEAARARQLAPPRCRQGLRPGLGRPVPGVGGPPRCGPLWRSSQVFLWPWARGAFSGGPAKAASLYQRTLQVAGQYRCPVCAGESVAASEAPRGGQVRGLIQGWLEEGRSQAQIRSYLVDDYGTSILEQPPASGLDVLVWVLPVVFGACVLGVVLVFAHWRRAGVVGAEPYERRPRRLARPVHGRHARPGNHRVPRLPRFRGLPPPPLSPRLPPPTRGAVLRSP